MKPWYKSKTVWLLILGNVADVLLLWVDQDWLGTRTILIVSLIRNHLLLVIRWLTVEPITSVSPRFDKLRRKPLG